MPGVECTARRYSCAKLPGVSLCPAAFAEGRFPAGCSAQDFVLIDSGRTKPDMVRANMLLMAFSWLQYAPAMLGPIHGQNDTYLCSQLAIQARCWAADSDCCTTADLNATATYVAHRGRQIFCRISSMYDIVASAGLSCLMLRRWNIVTLSKATTQVGRGSRLR